MAVNVDAVIPAYKPGEDLLDLLEKLQKQTVPVNRIIIINTEREFFDEKLYKIASNIEVVHITRKEFDHAATRDMGMRMSTGDYVLFMTMDAVPRDEKLVERLLSGFDSDEIPVAVSYARQLPKRGCRMAEKFTREFNYPEKNVIKTSADIENLGIKTFFCSDVCAMYDRKIYERLGGFVPRAIFNEDMIYAAKAIDAGYGIMYCADAEVYHSHNYTCMEQFRRNFDIGVSQAEHPEIFDRVSCESEGVKLVFKTAGYLLKHGHWYEVPHMVVTSAFKYIGYKKGRNFKKISLKKCLKYTSNAEYWLESGIKM